MDSVRPKPMDAPPVDATLWGPVTAPVTRGRRGSVSVEGGISPTELA